MERILSGRALPELAVMEFYQNLYVGESVRKVNTVKRKLRTGAGQFSVYLIALSHNSDQLDIFHCALLKQKYFDRKNLYIVGIAGSKGEAFQLVGKMLGETLLDGMEGDIKGYLRKNGAKGGAG